MYEYDDSARTDGDAGDARARARRALQDAYDWRDDEPRNAATSAAATATAPAAPRQRSAAARAEARRNRREVARSISRTLAV
ncbi:MAG: hypothetical protein ACRDSS_08650 [Actinocrinis sp.]